jgi:hypothetical protein
MTGHEVETVRGPVHEMHCETPKRRTRWTGPPSRAYCTLKTTSALSLRPNGGVPVKK